MRIDEHGRRSRARVTRRRLLLVATVAAVLAVALAFALTRGSESVSPAQVLTAVERSLASSGSISGVFVNDKSGARWRFTADSTGAFRIDGLTSRSVSVYDPAANVESTSAGSRFVRCTGLAPGSPDFVIEQRLGAVIAALAAASDPKVAKTTYDGRPAWLLSTPSRRVTVDRVTGVPVRNELLREGKVFSEWRIEGLRVSPTAMPIKPIEPRAGQDTQTYESGFQRVTLLEARSLAEYTPLAPQQLPAGFALSAVAYGANPRATGAADASNPPSLDVVSSSYGRGFDEIVVTTRRTESSTGSLAADWRDPLQGSTAVTAKPERIAFTGGALAGEHGYLVLEPDTLPHIWTAGPELVVTIAGTVDRAELLQVANSLHGSVR
jgi:hypothetical protein